MKKSPKTLRTGAAALAALLMTLAAGLEMTVARKLNPDAVDAGGFLYQLIGRTSRSFTLEPLAAACVLLLAFWLARRYLFRRAEGAKAGEYLLSAFLGGIALLCAAMRAGETVRLIWQNSFQLFKSLLIFTGMSLWFLYALRALAEWLSRPREEGRFCAFWDRHPFGFPFLVLLAAYGWQIAIKYPGVIHLDVVMPIRMVLGLSPKNNTFPPTGTLLYGGAFLLGEKLGNVNWAYFAIMLFQSVSLMLTLSYALWLMHTRKAPCWVQLLALTLFAVNPIYIGWITTLGKDAQYMVWMLLLGVLMMEFLAEPEAFCRKKSRWVLLTADCLLAVLTRYNGVSVAVPCLVAMLIVLCRRPALRRSIPCLLVCSALTIFAGVVVFICYHTYRGAAFSELRNTANIIAMTDADPAVIGDKIDKTVEEYHIRVTFIDSAGKVVYDSDEDIADMDNHADRQEVKQALKEGEGEDERLSETLDKTYCYYAIAYHGGVLRLARTRSSMITIVGSVFALLICAVGILLVIATVISIKLSENVMRPIHELVRRFDLSGESETDGEAAEKLDKGNVYEELEPVAETAEKLLDETHRIVRRLKKEKEKFSLITEKMAEGMILLDSDNTVLSVNRTALQLFNPNYDPASKMKLYDFTTEPQLWSLLEGLHDSNSARGIIKMGDQSWRTFLNKTEYAGKFGIVIILANVTESLRSEEIRRDFSANVSHELKTPLTTIKGFGEMMENGIITGADDIKRYGGTIYRESERLLSLINDIIRLSEIEDENSRSHMEQVNLLAAARDCEEILANKAETHGIEIAVSGEEVSVTGDRSYLVEMLLNLMDNSIKYNHEGGHVRTTIKAMEKGAQIEVADDGIGISEADRERVFERFYRVDKSRSKETGGTGLGLSIVKHIVGLHGGTLDIKSALGKGTAITVFIPYSHDDAEEE